MQPVPDPVSPRARPIHPLPKRRLRERLSAEAAGSITYPPPNPPAHTPIFHYPTYTPESGYGLKPEIYAVAAAAGSPSANTPSPDPRLRRHSGLVTRTRAASNVLPSNSNTTTANSATPTRYTSTRHGPISSCAFSLSNPPLTPTHDLPANLASASASASASTPASAKSTSQARRYSHPPELVSIAALPTPKSQSSKTKLNQSTFNGSPENGKNNKKRKIPIMAEPPAFSSPTGPSLLLHHAQAAASRTANIRSGSSTPLASSQLDVDTAVQSPSTPSPRRGHGFSPAPTPCSTPTGSGGNAALVSTRGISGPGRGMFGRARNPRSPLRATGIPGPHAWPDHRTTGIGPVPASAMGGAGSSEKPRAAPTWAATDTRPGIISNAIAMAGKLPVATGHENISLLAQHNSKYKSNPTETQFTFTCDSPDAKAVKWPGPGMHEATAYDPHYLPSPTEQYPPTMEGRRPSTKPAPQPAEENKEPAPMTLEQQRQERRKNRRALEKELADQARERRFQARRRMSKNPPSPLLDDEDYICLFCDYEAIFGEPPRYLIRSFEMRARNERIEEEKKRRRLEQVKARNRKGKKAAAGKAAAPKGTAATPSKANGLSHDEDDEDDAEDARTHDDFHPDDDASYTYDDGCETRPNDHDDDGESTDGSYRIDSSENGDLDADADAEVEDAQLEDEFGGTIHAKIRDLTVRVRESVASIRMQREQREQRRQRRRQGSLA
ncbi:uncharacterized protein BROUX77_007242 [Berkeleyomyces rouxiae]|uniref:uncharacterized protein n=1 Tax=Berkeleyomyces rouxiae TaxID=2035830 RepID=UPI003B7B31D5